MRLLADEMPLPALRNTATFVMPILSQIVPEVIATALVVTCCRGCLVRFARFYQHAGGWA